MTDPADLDQLCNAISSQGALIGRHEELLCGLMEGVQDVAESHNLALNALREQFHGMPTRQPTTTVTSQPLSNPAGKRRSHPGVPGTPLTSPGALRWRFQNLPDLSLPVLPRF